MSHVERGIEVGKKYLNQSGFCAGIIVNGDPGKRNPMERRNRVKKGMMKMEREKGRKTDLGGFIRLTSFSNSSWRGRERDQQSIRRGREEEEEEEERKRGMGKKRRGGKYWKSLREKGFGE